MKCCHLLLLRDNGRVTPRDPFDPQLRADLHCHSRHSDGALTPTELAHRAQTGGVQLWALTDHDNLAGQAEARSAAQALGLAYVAGVEISVTFAGETVHILGLNVDEQHAGLRDGLAQLCAGRDARAQAMGESLARAGVPGAYEGARALAPNLAGISRTHFARYIVAQGHVASVHEVFSRYLKPGKPGYVPHQWAKLSEAVGWIRAAGGVAVIAHPRRYGFSAMLEYALIGEFIAHGGQGIEVVCGSHSAADALHTARLAQEFGLLASTGSDFHADGETRAALGSLPPLPATLTPVWAAFGQSVAA